MFELLALVGVLGGFAWLVGQDRLENRLKGGRGDTLRLKDVDPVELSKGIRHEREHIRTGDKASNRRLAQEIALDHLAEYDDYYSILEESEKKMHKRGN
jgi:hypothetical protein